MKNLGDVIIGLLSAKIIKVWYDIFRAASWRYMCVYVLYVIVYS